ncbi:hypothetical protein [Hyphococcus lacteus]|uniref:DUF2946 domain-containing protein n=1 Tax=Hyphococcus lacteus TaxID=3143536 RepID=A0ABV3Z3P3_9PROT
MITSRLKVIIFTALALILSVGHSFCAELAASVPSSQMLAVQTVDDAHQGHKQAVNVAHHGDRQREPAAEHAPCSPDQSTCEHCDSAQFFNAASINFIAALNPPSPFVAVPLSDIIVSSERIVSRAVLTALRKHGPPGDTPISLKIKLQN